jgi:hypothetical protein
VGNATGQIIGHSGLSGKVFGLDCVLIFDFCVCVCVGVGQSRFVGLAIPSFNQAKDDHDIEQVGRLCG